MVPNVASQASNVALPNVPKSIKLTPKQSRFIEGIRQGVTPIDAYRSAYDVDPKVHPSIVQRDCSRLLTSQTVRCQLEALGIPLGTVLGTEAPGRSAQPELPKQPEAAGKVGKSEPSQTVASARPGESVKPRKPQALTAKQAKFVELYANGMSKMEAFREAYQPNGTESTNRSNLAALLESPTVKPLIQEIDDRRRSVIESTILPPEEIRKFCMDELFKSATTEKGSTKLKAVELLGKTRGVGLFESEVKHTHDIGDNLTSLIAGLLASLPQSVVSKVLPPEPKLITSVEFVDSKESENIEPSDATENPESPNPTVPQDPL